MYWENYEDQRLEFRKDEEPTARKEHECCECGRIVKIGEKYSYFFGVWQDFDFGAHRFVGAHKTCLECKQDWDEILEVFHNNGEEDAMIVFGSLKEAIQDAYDASFLTEADQLHLVKKWLGIEPEVDVENLSPEGREEYERKETLAQLRTHNLSLFP